MKRVRVILGWLLAGAAVNVAVAWAASCFVDPNDGTAEFGFVDKGEEPWIVQWRRHYGITEIYHVGIGSYRDRSVALTADVEGWNRLELPRWNVFPSRGDVRGIWGEGDTVRAVGFPLRSLRCQFSGGILDLMARARGGGPVGGFSIRDGELVEADEKGEVRTPLATIDYMRGGMVLGTSDIYSLDVLPCRPLLVGFAVNMVFWACVIWGMVVVPVRYWNYLERRSRMNRGLCPSCEYDLRGTDHAACPECGAELIKTKQP